MEVEGRLARLDHFFTGRRSSGCASGGANTSPCTGAPRRAPRVRGNVGAWTSCRALADGRPFRILTVVDQWSRSSPLLEVASRMSGYTVGEALDRVLDGRATAALHHGGSRHRVPVAGARRLGVSPRGPARLHPSRQAHRKRVHRVVQWAAPGRVPERAPVRVDRRCANKIEAWRLDYNQRRPHGSLGHLTPNEFAEQRQAMRVVEDVGVSS